ncbi:helix-turn-helix DNA-binding protein [Gordonia phage Horus]|uniref:Helix-turn-helix DNA binding protein n=1 Tax=Gordonia phage Horus TaxID=2301696 RepID=A0A385DX09_9CAUD|nr:hypothetical protein HOT93_gp098 [Gordonia phage Horus]AXQ63904.1 helix-turn-helix DNA-binding protein [Gordonia phage Horus]
MTAQEFEIIFVTEPIADPCDERIDRAMELVPGSTVTNYGALTLASVFFDAETAVEAGLHAAKALESAGISVVRTYQDLVSRQDIADRAGTTRQAVGHWVRGARLGGDFPAPTTLVGGGAWLWGDVVAWMRQQGLEVEPTGYPTLADHLSLDRMIARGVGSLTIGPMRTGEVSFAEPTVRSTPADYHVQGHFGLAA